MSYQAITLPRNITERTQTHKMVRTERERLQSTLNAAEVATWTVQAAPNRVSGDAALRKFFGLTEEEAANATPETYINRIHPDDAPAVAAALQHSMTTGEKFDVTYRVPQGNGTVRWLDARGRAAFDASGRFLHLYGMFMDVTARREA
jgi:PAS domain S-box-containing protein